MSSNGNTQLLGSGAGRTEKTKVLGSPVDIKLADIDMDQSFQQRVNLTNEATVTTYAEQMREGVQFPPLRLARLPDERLVIFDGFQRFHAAQQAELDTLPAYVVEMEPRLALLESLRANTRHGLPLSNTDKRKIIETALKDEELKQLSERELAEFLGLPKSTIHKVKTESKSAHMGRKKIASKKGGGPKAPDKVAAKDPSDKPRRSDQLEKDARTALSKLKAWNQERAQAVAQEYIPKPKTPPRQPDASIPPLEHLHRGLAELDFPLALREFEEAAKPKGYRVFWKKLAAATEDQEKETA